MTHDNPTWVKPDRLGEIILYVCLLFICVSMIRIVPIIADHVRII